MILAMCLPCCRVHILLAYILPCIRTCSCHALAMLLPCSCHSLAMCLAAAWRCVCCAIKVLSCYVSCKESCSSDCKVFAWVPRAHTNARYLATYTGTVLPCSCHALAMLLPCSCHAPAMLLPCSCHAPASLLPGALQQRGSAFVVQLNCCFAVSLAMILAMCLPC